MKVIETKLNGAKIIHPTVFEDERGYFSESFNQQIFDAQVAAGISFVQDNHSHSKRGVLRGLHYQMAPKAQGSW
jgi:dTDP-4-dehydrorhamnose 3,5-epimerase